MTNKLRPGVFFYDINDIWYKRRSFPLLPTFVTGKCTRYSRYALYIDSLQAERYGHGRPGVCPGEGHTDAESVLTQGGGYSNLVH